VVNALIHHCGDSLSGVGGEKRPGIVHRIDKDTSGLLVAAKSDRAHHGLAAQFEDHSVNRRYLAICYGAPDQNDPRIHGVKGTNFEPGNILKVQTFLGRHKTDRQRQAVSFTQGRHAVTRARIIESLGVPPVAALLECWLETGRTHQIRVHMAHVGHSLIGDPVYGGRRKLNVKAIGEAGAEAAAAFSRQALHAATLGFEHPVTGEWIEFESDLPEDMQALLTALGGS
jgi:23S rRNA pseudouridine1911/1915/1917 synthase